MNFLLSTDENMTLTNIQNIDHQCENYLATNGKGF